MSWINGSIGEWTAWDDVDQECPGAKPQHLGQAEEVLRLTRAIRNDPKLSELLSHEDVTLTYESELVVLETFPLMKPVVEAKLAELGINRSVTVHAK